MRVAPLLPHGYRVGREGLGGQTGHYAGYPRDNLLEEKRRCRCSWGGYPRATDDLFEQHELGIVLARRMFAA